MYVGKIKLKYFIAVLKITYHCLCLSELWLTLIRMLKPITFLENIIELYGTSEFYATLFIGCAISKQGRRVWGVEGNLVKTVVYRLSNAQ